MKIDQSSDMEPRLLDDKYSFEIYFVTSGEWAKGGRRKELRFIVDFNN